MSNKIKKEMDKIVIPKNISERSMLGVNQAKAKTLFFVLLIILLPLNSYIYKFVFQYIYGIIPMTWTGIMNVFVILFYLLVLIPLTIYLSEKLVKYSLTNGRKGKVFLSLLIIVPITVFSLNLFDVYREKGLDEVINYRESNFESLVFNEGNPEYEWRTDNKEQAEEIRNFLSQYRVKRMKDREWDSDVSSEKGVRITVYTKGNPIITSIYEERVLDVGSGPYWVVNGPIDVEWLINYMEEHSQ
ncbi:hypothetical protein ACERII_14560 [Evansella sp. AB-rgal1]|uniref:hypothetical protein n=1 Tax=Evansella sp. AB-rgal1 TaxID=3242696 RepID=UPI00359D0CAC